VKLSHAILGNKRQNLIILDIAVNMSIGWGNNHCNKPFRYTEGVLLSQKCSSKYMKFPYLQDDLFKTFIY